MAWNKWFERTNTASLIKCRTTKLLPYIKKFFLRRFFAHDELSIKWSRIKII